MKRILVTGSNGLLGQKLVAVLNLEYEVLASGRQDYFLADPLRVTYQRLDITEAAECKRIVQSFDPDVIINSAAFTHVDACEENREACWQVNVKGVANLAFAARKNMAKLIHISTDYVFDGEDGPYSEDAKPNPAGYYGKSKLASENEVRMAGIPYAIVRTNVIYGTGVKINNNFFLWVYKSLAAGKNIRVVTDQFNNPVLAEDLAEGIRLIVNQSKYGVFNIAGGEYMNRYDYARKVAKAYDFDEKLIEPITTAELQQKSPRPLKGGLIIDSAKASLDFAPRSLEDALSFLKPGVATG